MPTLKPAQWNRYRHHAPELEDRHPDFWPPALREEWEERAAILEFDAGLDREAAEAVARMLVAKRARAGR